MEEEGMDKYSVVTDEGLTKTSAPGECPWCGAELDRNSNVPMCPKCGTKPFEKAPERGGE